MLTRKSDCFSWRCLQPPPTVAAQMPFPVHFYGVRIHTMEDFACRVERRQVTETGAGQISKMILPGACTLQLPCRLMHAPVSVALCGFPHHLMAVEFLFALTACIAPVMDHHGKDVHTVN